MMIEQFMADRNQPGGRQLGLSHRYTLRTLQRGNLGPILPADVRAVDFLTHCKARRASGRQPSTVNQDMTYVGGMLKYHVEILETPGAEVAYAAYKKAQPQLIREQLVGKSQPRTRRPTPEELATILAHYAAQSLGRKNSIPMHDIVKFAYLTGRRISETCRILWADLDTEKRTCTVRDLKNSKGKGFHDTFPLLGEAWDLVMAQPRTSERIFPREAKSCTQNFINMKKALGMPTLRLHDMRREAFSRMFEEGYSVPEVQKLSLHRNAKILLENYTALAPESLHLGPASKRATA